MSVCQGEGMPRQMVKHLSMSVQMFLEEISIRISRLSTEDVFTHAVGSPSRAQTEQKGGGRVTAFSAWAGMSIASCPWTSVLLVFGPLNSGWDFYHQFPRFSGLRTQLSWLSACDCKPWDFSTPIIMCTLYVLTWGYWSTFQYLILIHQLCF